MIKINSNFTINKDSHQWILTEIRTQIMEKGKYTGQEKEVIRETYHSTIDQIANTIIERSDRDCESLEELKELYRDAVKLLSVHIERLNIAECTKSAETSTAAAETSTTEDLDTDSDVDKEIEEENAKHPAAPLAKKKRKRKLPKI